MSLSSIINGHMHGGRCPTAGSLGECPAIWLHSSDATHGGYYAAVYLWTAAIELKFAEIARWFTDAIGCPADDVSVEVIVHDTGNEVLEGFCSDGARALTVTFSVNLARAAELGLELPKEPAGPETSPRMSADDLMGIRQAAPHVTPQMVQEVAALPVDQLQARLLSSLAGPVQRHVDGAGDASLMRQALDALERYSRWAADELTEREATFIIGRLKSRLGD